MPHDPFILPSNTKPKLTVVDGAKGKPILTAKQQGFLDGVTRGRLTASDAYRAAYDCENMQPKTIHCRASELMAHREISARIRRYWRAEERSRQSDAASKGALIIEKLEAIADDPRVSAASRIRALELLGKQRDVALFVDRSVDETGMDNRTPDEVRQELEQKLGELLGVTAFDGAEI